MQMKDLIKPIHDMTDEELQDHLRTIRHKRTSVKKATTNRVARAAKKGATGRINKIDSIVSGMSEADKQQLILQLQQEQDNG